MGGDVACNVSTVYNISQFQSKNSQDELQYDNYLALGQAEGEDRVDRPGRPGRSGPPGRTTRAVAGPRARPSTHDPPSKQHPDRHRLNACRDLVGAAGQAARGLRHGVDERAQLHLSLGTQGCADIQGDQSARPGHGWWHARHRCSGRDARGARVRQDLPGCGRESDRRPCEGSGRVPAPFPGPERRKHGRVADDGSHPLAQAGRPAAGATFQLAPGTGMRLGTRACGNHPDQPRVPVAVRLLQRELLRAQYGPQAGGPGHRRAQLPGRPLGHWLLRHPRLDVLPEPELAEGMDREVSHQSQQALDLLGGRPRRHRAPMARPVRGAG